MTEAAATRSAGSGEAALEAAAVGVLIVDDSAPFRRAARAVIAATSGFVTVGEAASGEEALLAMEDLDPSLVLLDVTMGGIDGIETARRITAAYPRPTVVLVSVHDPARLPSEVESCGAVAFLDKRDFSPARLADLWATHRPAA
jgi:DNA-binding NarL/FixJ family response regulator